MKRVLAPFISLSALFLGGCAVTTHANRPADLGVSVGSRAMEARLDEPGPIVLETIVAADWSVPLSGMLDLDHPVAEAAGLEDRDEPIQIYLWVLRHPTEGTTLIDSGVARGIRDGTSDVVGTVVEWAMHTEALQTHVDTASWLAAQPSPPARVLITHLHLDHILGLADIPAGTPIYVGPGEAQATRFLNAAVQGTTDRALAGHDALRTLAIPPDPDGVLTGVLDVFGDGSLYAIHAPGHTPGMLAFVVRTTEGPVLLTGDVSHTTWGFAHGVAPGSYSADREQGQRSLDGLRELAARHPSMRVRAGHQSFADPRADAILGATSAR